jgi:hypothetical protein
VVNGDVVNGCCHGVVADGDVVDGDAVTGMLSTGMCRCARVSSTGRPRNQPVLPAVSGGDDRTRP